MPKQSDPREWLRFAEADLAAARSLLATPDLPARIACFHAHQATEKALKASLVASGTPFRKTHDLAILVGLQPEAIRSLLGDVDLELLQPWAVETRYPSDLPDATTSEASSAVTTAAEVLAVVNRAIEGREPA